MLNDGGLNLKNPGFVKLPALNVTHANLPNSQTALGLRLKPGQRIPSFLLGLIPQN